MMREFLNKPISEIFKKSAMIEKNDTEQIEKKVHFLNRPISELFKRSAELPNTFANTTLITNVEQIISKLDSHYHEVLDLFLQIEQLQYEAEIDKALLYLESFRQQFKDYLVLESGTLYQYLQNSQIGQDIEQQRTMSEYRLEMHRFTNTVLRFLRKWMDQQRISQQGLANFQQEYASIYDLLIARIHNEHGVFGLLHKFK